MAKKTKRELQKLNAKMSKDIEAEEHKEYYDKIISNDSLAQAQADVMSDDLLKNFEQSISSNEPIRELVGNRNIKLKTNVTDEQRMAIVVLNSVYNYSKKFEHLGLDLNVLADILEEFILLAPSVDGKRAEQYVDAHKALMQFQAQQQQQGMSQLNNVKQNSING